MPAPGQEEPCCSCTQFPGEDGSRRTNRRRATCSLRSSNLTLLSPLPGTSCSSRTRPLPRAAIIDTILLLEASEEEACAGRPPPAPHSTTATITRQRCPRIITPRTITITTTITTASTSTILRCSSTIARRPRWRLADTHPLRGGTLSCAAPCVMPSLKGGTEKRTANAIQCTRERRERRVVERRRGARRAVLGRRRGARKRRVVLERRRLARGGRGGRLPSASRRGAPSRSSASRRVQRRPRHSARWK
mmetsp:Transcript_36525/g.85456  ORF Transcript_36525/g.85456 Transcript_36525/m.85456 type:complete len:249 (-) Transcript_36525:1531-2277(-)